MILRAVRELRRIASNAGWRRGCLGGMDPHEALSTDRTRPLRGPEAAAVLRFEARLEGGAEGEEGAGGTEERLTEFTHQRGASGDAAQGPEAMWTPRAGTGASPHSAAVGGITVALLLAVGIGFPDSARNPSNVARPHGFLDGPQGPSAGSSAKGAGDAQRQEAIQMSKNSIRASVVAGVALLAASAGAQAQAVQWKVADGGNGHWYQLRSAMSNLRQSEAQTLAIQAGGHLITGCGTEFDFAVQQTGALNPTAWVDWAGPWIGLARQLNGPWQWVDGSDCTFDRWETGDGQPNGGNDVVVLLWQNDRVPRPLCHDHYDSAWTRFYLVEWSADCNNDGVVDYGQCRDGTLADVNGNNVPDCCESSTDCVSEIHVPAQFQTIQSAIDAALPGSSVLVAPGVYHEQIDLRGKSIHLIGTAGAAATVLDGDGVRTVVIGANEPPGTEFAGFTIRNGNGDIAGGMSVANSSIRVHHCVFRANVASNWWGAAGFRSSGGASTVEDCTFTENRNPNCSTSGGWYHFGGGTFKLSRCDFVRNASSGVVAFVNSEFGNCNGSIEDCSFAGQTRGADCPYTWGCIGVHAVVGTTIHINRCNFTAGTGVPTYAVASGSGSNVAMVDCSACGFEFGLFGTGTTAGCAFSSTCADCNGNGVPDFEDILVGGASDTNHDRIPDSCQCEADLNRDGQVDGADLSSILAFWGPTGSVFPAADLNRDGRVDGFDLSMVLAAWGTCGQ